MQRLEPLARSSDRHAREFEDALFRFIRLCKYNLAFLTPYYFPRYPKDEPLNFRDYPFSFSLFNFEIGTSTTVRAGRQIAKCRPKSATEPVMSSDGDPIHPAELQPGQHVLALDNDNNLATAEIVAIHDTGLQPIWRVMFQSGKVLRLSVGHPLKTSRGWVEVQKLSCDDFAVSVLENNDVTWDRVKSLALEGEEETWDIELNRHHNYVLSGIISHNTTSLGARQLLNAKFIPRFASMYITPRYEQLYTYAKKLREMEVADRFYHKDTTFPKNLFHKQFSNGSKIELTYVNTTDERVRGKSVDELIVDEAQGFDPELDIPVHEVVNASKISITFYSGTSLTTDTFLEHKFSISSAACWVMKCGCGHHNIPDLEHKVLDMIQPQGPSCAKCGRLLDVRNGEFVHANQKALAIGHYGFHIPQIIMPSVAYHANRWDKLYDKKISGNVNKFLQEILGIPTEEGEREITEQQLKDICILGNNLEKLKARALARKYRFVISGCDWGGSDYNPDLNMKASTTVHSIVGVNPDGKIDIIRMDRYYGMQYEDIIASILGTHQAYNGTAIASDFGVGAYYNSKIREVIPHHRHLMFNYTGPLTAMISEPKTSHPPNTWNLNKTESISTTYDGIRQKRIRCYDWSLAQPYLKDFLNLYRAPGEKKGETGLTVMLYRSHPTKTTDTLMAVNYCYMLAKILLGESLVPDVTLQRRIMGQIIPALNMMGGHGPGVVSG